MGSTQFLMSMSWGSCPSSSRYLPHAHCARQLRMDDLAHGHCPGELQAARRRQRMRVQSAGALSDDSAGAPASTSSEPAGTSTGANAAGRDGKAKAGAWLRQRLFSRLQASSGHESDDSDATSRASSSNDLQVEGLGLPALVEVAVVKQFKERHSTAMLPLQHLHWQCWPGSIANIGNRSGVPWLRCP